MCNVSTGLPIAFQLSSNSNNKLYGKLEEIFQSCRRTLNETISFHSQVKKPFKAFRRHINTPHRIFFDINYICFVTIPSCHNECRLVLRIHCIYITAFFNEQSDDFLVSYINTQEILLSLVIGLDFICNVNEWIRLCNYHSMLPE